ncbi:MAG TPA: erythromycin esterase family protein [Jiangellales bacterium]|nr:erythromycin esterase family protein [Jiangellales bacterium]
MPSEFTPLRRDVLRMLAGTAVGAGIIGIPQPATASTPAGSPVPEWIGRHAHRLATSDPDATPHDLRHLHGMMRGALIVGLGESTHGAREEFTLKHRLVRHLVEHQGFRSVVLEEDWTKGLQIDEYLQHGQGDPQVLLADAGTPWRTEEILDLLVWMRAYNQSHPGDPVRFAGADVVAVRASAYDAVTAYVARVAPQYLDELRAHYTVLRPSGDIGAHIAFYRQRPDKQPYIDHARQAYQMVAGLPAEDGLPIVLQHAQAIVGFYEYHATGSVGVRDRHMAQTVTFWREYTGDRVIYWAHNGHTANGHPLTISYPPFPPATQDTAGSLLHTRYGRSYLSVGMSFHHGTVNAGFFPVQAYPVPAPPAHFVDATLAVDGIGNYLLDLRTAAPPQVRRWLHTPILMRAIGPAYDPANDAAYHMSGGGLGDWFDVIIHQQQVTPTRLLP